MAYLSTLLISFHKAWFDLQHLLTRNHRQLLLEGHSISFSGSFYFLLEVIRKDVKNIRCKMSHGGNSQDATHLEHCLPFITTLYL